MQRKGTQGVRARHSRTCRSKDGANCNCRPAWEAYVYIKTDGRKLRKTFDSQAAAKAWRADAMAANNQGKLRAPTGETVREAWDAWHARAVAGNEPNKSGNPYKPAALRGYERSMRLRVLPVFGRVKMTAVRKAEV